jgi:hypothetical protein
MVIPAGAMDLEQELRRALVARRQSEPLKVIAGAVGVSPALLSRFARAQRGLSLRSASKLYRYLSLEK